VAQINLTARAVEGLKVSAGDRVDYWDRALKGFGVRVSRRGMAPQETKTYFIRYRVGKRMRRLTIGDARKVSLADARTKARASLVAVDEGQDPAIARRVHRQAGTFEELGELYLEKHAKRRKRSWQADDRIIKAELLPPFRHVKVKDLTRRQIRELVDEIAERGAPILANRTLALVRKMLNFAIDREWIDANPASRMAMPGTERQRDRVLGEDEIRALWQALDDEEEAGRLPISAFYKLRLITAQRGQEVALMRWQDIDPADRVWTQPSETTKNRLAHRVPLSPQAWDLLGGLRAWQGDRVTNINRLRVERKKLEPVKASQWVFPSPRRDKGDRSMQRNLQNAVDRIKEAAGIDFNPHDLRRTAASHMTASGIPRDIVKKILNHVEREVTAIYDRYSYDREKRAALNSWGKRVDAILSGKREAAKVVGSANWFRGGREPS
jgi:integrase